MNKENLQNYSNIITNNIEKDLKVISSIVYHYDVRKITEQLEELTKEDLEKVLEKCINDYLCKIQQNALSIEEFKKVDRDVDELIDFYNEDDFEEVIEEASEVTYDLIMKVINHNSRTLKLPIQIDFIKTFCIHNMIKEKDVDLTILFIVLHLSAYCYCLDHNTYSNESSK